MMDNENIIDLGSIFVPTSWEDVTLKMFQELERYYANTDKDFDLREVLHIMIGKDIDYVSNLPISISEKIMEKMSFLQTEPAPQKPTNKIEIDGEIYEVNVMEKMKTGEFVATDTITKSDKYNYAAILAVICRKKGEIYDSKFEAEVFDDRVKMFEETSVMKIMPVLSFFLSSYVTLAALSQMYSEVEEAVNHTQRSIETSHNLGVFRKLYLNWQTRKLLKSLKSNNNTLQIR